MLLDECQFSTSSSCVTKYRHILGFRQSSGAGRVVQVREKGVIGLPGRFDPTPCARIHA